MLLGGVSLGVKTTLCHPPLNVYLVFNRKNTFFSYSFSSNVEWMESEHIMLLDLSSHCLQLTFQVVESPLLFCGIVTQVKTIYRYVCMIFTKLDF